MKKIIILITIFFSVSIFGATSCKDVNFNNIKDFISYDKIKFHHRFIEFKSYDSVTPGHLFETFYDLDLDNQPNYASFCFSVQADYFTHKQSKKKYIMYTTHEDACDGGNVIGLVVDIEKYQKGKVKESIVAEVSDGAFTCIK